MEKVKEKLVEQLMEQRKSFSDAIIALDFNNMNAHATQVSYTEEIKGIDARIDKLLG